MIIVVPTNSNKGLEDSVAQHFGRCKTYTFLNEKGELIEVIDNTSEHMGGEGLPPELMKEHNANVLLCKGLGFRAIKLCNEFDIKVYVHKSESVKELFKLWKDNKLKRAGSDDACKEHG